jgi:hypothetical protein
MLVRAAMGSHSSSNNLWKVWERFCLTSVSCFQQPALKLSQQTAGPALADPSARAHVALCAAGRCEPDTGKRENLERKPANVVAHCGGSNPPWSPMLMLRSCLTVCEQFIPSYPDAGENPQVRSFCFILMFNQFLSIGRRLYIYIHTYIYMVFLVANKKKLTILSPMLAFNPWVHWFQSPFFGPQIHTRLPLDGGRPTGPANQLPPVVLPPGQGHSDWTCEDLGRFSSQVDFYI